MPRQLLILRHAKSAWDTDALTDFDRPLAARGRQAAPRMGRWMLEQGLLPDHVVSSPAERARQTVLAACAELGFDPDRIHWDQRIYHGSAASMLDVLRECPDTASRVLIAGHNPGLETLLIHLCGSGVHIPRDGKLLPTAALAQLEINASWGELQQGSARLLSIKRARSLTKN